MNRRRWFFVTAPFIVFSIYAFLVSASYPGAPERARWLVSLFLAFTVVLLVVQRAMLDDNYFVPTLVLVLLVNSALSYSFDARTFDGPGRVARIAGLLLERPQLILYGGLLMMALVPPLLWRGSFTCYFSRLDYPEEDWHNPEFVRVNRRISFFWVGVFLLCFLTQFVPVLAVQLAAPMLIVTTLGAWGTTLLVRVFIRRLDEE